MLVIRGSCVVLIQDELVIKGHLENWIAIILNYRGKVLVVINIYRLPTTSLRGVYYSLI